jgi:hypothetical protein
MKLSEAIRRGAKMRPQNFGSFYDSNGTGTTCALGAAGEGFGILGACLKNEFGILRPIGDRVGAMFYDATHPSPCGCIPIGWMLHNQIAHLNDVHKWSREAIAEWVEVIENKTAPVILTGGSSADSQAKCQAVDMGSTPTLATILTV